MPIPYYTRAEIDMMFGKDPSEVRIYFYTDTSPKPVEGEDNVLYVDKSNYKAEVWDINTSTYEIITGEDTVITYQMIIDALGFTPADVEQLNNYYTKTELNAIHVTFLTEETDPVFVASPAYGITPTNITNWSQAFSKMVSAISVTGDANKILTITFQDSTTLTASFTDMEGGVADGDEYVNSLNFNTSDGVLTVGRTGTLTDITVSLDGRYLTSIPTHTHLWAEITDKPATFPPSAHTHAWSDITDPPVFVTGAALSGVDSVDLTVSLSDGTTVESSYFPVIETFIDADNGNTYSLREGYNDETGTSGENIILGFYNIITHGWGNFVTGRYQQVAGSGHTVLGSNNQVIGNNTFNSLVSGAYNKIRTMYSAIIGYNNQDSHPAIAGTMPYPDGGNLIAGWNNNISSGMAIGMFGSGHIQTGNNLLVVGQNSINLNGAQYAVNTPTDARFIVGNGNIVPQTYVRGNAPSNAFVVYHSGLVVAPTLTSALIDTQARSLVTREYLQAALGGVGGGAPSAHTHPWTDITATPTTLSGYGITDGVRGITGSGVDNTDPLNPIINNPSLSLQNVLDVGNSADTSSPNGSSWWELSLENNFDGYLQYLFSNGFQSTTNIYQDASLLNLFHRTSTTANMASIDLDESGLYLRRSSTEFTEGAYSTVTIGTPKVRTTFSFPQPLVDLATRVLPISVNGIFADAEGNITVPTDGGGIETETDPIFVASEAYGITAVNKTNWTTAYNKHVTAVSVTGDANKILTLTFQDSTTLTASFTDMEGGVADGDEYVNSLNFDSANGVLTVGRTGTLTDITVSLDGRYLTSLPAHTHTWEEITGKPTLVKSVTGTAVDNTDPENPIINQVGQRFGVSGEDDTFTEDRSIQGGNQNLIMYDTTFGVYSSDTIYNEDVRGNSNFRVSPFTMYMDWRESVHLDQLARVVVGEGSTYGGATRAVVKLESREGVDSDKAKLIELLPTGFYYYNSEQAITDPIMMPTSNDGYLALEVNGVKANAAGQITIPIDGGGGGIESVTGTGVDNTDPLNPIVKFNSLQEIYDSAAGLNNYANDLYITSGNSSLDIYLDSNYGGTFETIFENGGYFGVQGQGSFLSMNVNNSSPSFQWYGYGSSGDEDTLIDARSGQIELQATSYNYQSTGERVSADVYLEDGVFLVDTIRVSSANTFSLKTPTPTAITGISNLTFPFKTGDYTLPITVNGIAANAAGEITIPIDGGGGGGVQSVTGDGVDNTDPLNPIINLPTASASRFGFVGEDDTLAENREVSIAANTRIFFNTANQDAKFEVGSKIDINQWRDRLEVAKHTFTSYIRYSNNNSHTMISHSGQSINLEAYNYTTGLNHLFGMNGSGFWFENGNDTLLLPDNKGGYFPLTVNGIAADSEGNITLPIDGGGVQSVTGTAVDNTDPLNPIINIPTGGSDSPFRAIETVGWGAGWESIEPLWATGNVNLGGRNLYFGLNNNIDGISNLILNGDNNTINDGSTVIVNGDNNTTDYASYSIISGQYNSLEAEESIIVGNSNNIGYNGFFSAVMGYFNDSDGYASAMFGEDNLETNSSGYGGWNVIGGYQNELTQGRGNAIFGFHNHHAGDFALIGGVGINLTTLLPNPRMVIGNGTVISQSNKGIVTKSNAFAVYQDGLVVAHSIDNAKIAASTTGKVLITREYLEANAGGGGIETETDPIFVASQAYDITATNKTNWTEAYNKKVSAVTVTGDENKILTLTFQDSTTLTANFTDIAGVADGDEYVNSLNFNSTNGVLTVGRTGELTDITVSLDGRYLTSLPAHGHDWSEISGKPATFTPSAHTHLWADITDKPTTFTPSAHTHTFASLTSKPTTISGYGITDAYTSWNLKTNGVQRTTVQNGGTLDIVGTGAAGVTYGAGGVVTINVPVVTPTDISKTVQVDNVQSFTSAEQKQGRANIVAEKRSEVRIPTVNPTNQNFIDWESDILLVKTARTFTLPASGVLVNGSRYLVKTTSTGTVQFAAADGTVSIEYNDVNATGYMAQRSEAWVLFQDNVYYVSGEVV